MASCSASWVMVALIIESPLPYIIRYQLKAPRYLISQKCLLVIKPPSLIHFLVTAPSKGRGLVSMFWNIPPSLNMFVPLGSAESLDIIMLPSRSEKATPTLYSLPISTMLLSTTPRLIFMPIAPRVLPFSPMSLYIMSRDTLSESALGLKGLRLNLYWRLESKKSNIHLSSAF